MTYYVRPLRTGRPNQPFRDTLRRVVRAHLPLRRPETLHALLMQAVAAMAALFLLFGVVAMIGMGINVFRAGLDYCARSDMAVIEFHCGSEICGEADIMMMRAAINRMSYDAAESNLARHQSCNRANPLKIG